MVNSKIFWTGAAALGAVSTGFALRSLVRPTEAGVHADKEVQINAADLSTAFDNPTVKAETIPVVTDDGISLNVQMYGPVDGEPIVFSHGWTCSAEYWNPQINAFAGKYRVITYDQRGHGRSEMSAGALNADMLGDDLQAVLEATIIPGKKALLVGHSMGGMSIMSWAARHSHQVGRFASAALLSSTATGQLIVSNQVVPGLAAQFPKIVDRFGHTALGVVTPRVKSSRFLRAGIQYVAMAPGSTAAEVEFCERIIIECSPKTRAKWGAVLSRLDLVEALDQLTVPTSVLVGAVDRLTPPIHSDALAQRLASTGYLERHVVVPGVGHMSSIEAVTQFNSEVQRLRDRGE
ncbi:MAG: alpha/beta fold hydrolase [Mycobacteriaceae bacterium]